MSIHCARARNIKYNQNECFKWKDYSKHINDFLLENCSMKENFG